MLEGLINPGRLGMDAALYVVTVEDPEGTSIASSSYASEADARREIAKGLMNPDYQGCEIWLSYPVERGVRLSSRLAQL